ncbi:MAG: FAD:protein FMN transferase [Collinsella sp.]|nr:FAD:protein FMN transferase [Collinsella sp.]
MPDRAKPIPLTSRIRPLSRRGVCAGAFGFAVLASGCSRPSAEEEVRESVTGSTFAFDTYCTFTVYGDADAPALLARECARFDGLFNAYDPDSDIARINAAGGAPVIVDPDTLELVQKGLEFSSQAQGRFDITIGAVSMLWDFTSGRKPDDKEIQRAIGHVDWRGVEVDPDASTVRLADPSAKLDLGGIAKGFVADRLCTTLSDRGCTAAVISLGGNIVFHGRKPDGALWDAGIRDPNDPGGSTVVGTVHIPEGSLVTSGLYERMFESDGTTYWHILDPRTGMPVQTDIESVTVLCPSSTAADALSTTLFIAGSVDGADMAHAHEGTAAYFIKRDGGTAESPRWQELTDFEA